MKYCRFLLDSEPHYGAVKERNGELWIERVISAPEEDLAFRLAHACAASPDDFGSFEFEPIPLTEAVLLAPVTPSKIICVGRNYKAHVAELGNEVPKEPMLFFKPPSSLLGSGGVVRLPAGAGRVDFEGELVLVIGKRAHKLKPEDDWREIVRGVTLADDISARELQKKDGQWARAKGYDTFCPIGPIVSDELNLEAGLTIETRVNGEVRQHATTLDLIFPIPELLVYITAAFTLEPGDILLTGTPAGVGPLAAGDRVEVTIAGLGTLANSVEAD